MVVVVAEDADADERLETEVETETKTEANAAEIDKHLNVDCGSCYYCDEWQAMIGCYCRQMRLRLTQTHSGSCGYGDGFDVM